MRIPHSLLIGAAIAAWVAGRLSAPVPAQTPSAPPAFGIAGSAYGSLVARMMRDSLYAYWHGGERTRNHVPQMTPADAGSLPPPPPPMPGRFSRRGQPQPAPAPVAPPPVAVVEEPTGSLLERATRLIARLESNRTRREGPLVISAAHSRYLEAAADWRLRLACDLDPGDAVLYEILHFQLQSRASSPAAAQKASEELALRAVKRAMSHESGMGDYLTGAGAAINLLNFRLQPGQTDVAAASQVWRDFDKCMGRYRTLKSDAQRDGWWLSIPEVRRAELENHARFLETLAGRIRVQLSQRGILSQASLR